MDIGSAKTLVSTAASLAASAMVVRSMARDPLCVQLRHLIFISIKGIFKSLSGQITLIIDEFDSLSRNQFYGAAEIYLGTKLSPLTEIYRVSLPEKETNIKISMVENQQVIDIYEGVQFR